MRERFLNSQREITPVKAGFGTRVDKVGTGRPKNAIAAQFWADRILHVNKSAVRQGILDQLRNELAVQTRAAQVSHEEATSEESRAENKYDMHSQEAAYLAEGQARLATEIAENILLYETLNISPVPKDGLRSGSPAPSQGSAWGCSHTIPSRLFRSASYSGSSSLYPQRCSSPTRRNLKWTGPVPRLLAEPPDSTGLRISLGACKRR